MKKKVLLSSIVTIALCLCLIAGSTFALFTDSTNFNIAVTSGDVEIRSTAEVVQRWSAEGADGAHDDKYLKDENGNYYKHVERDAAFINGGTADVNDEGTLVISKITPGDKVDVRINTQNLSDVAFRFRYTVKVAEDNGLATGMVLTTHSGDEYEAVKSFTSEWFAVVEPGAAVPSKDFSIELPVYAKNEYQSEHKNGYDENGVPYTEDDVKDVTYTILVEAVQGNAVVDGNTTTVIVYPTSGAVQAAVANGGIVALDGGNVALDGAFLAKDGALVFADGTFDGTDIPTVTEAGETRWVLCNADDEAGFFNSNVTLSDGATFVAPTGNDTHAIFLFDLAHELRIEKGASIVASAGVGSTCLQICYATVDLYIEDLASFVYDKDAGAYAIMLTAGATLNITVPTEQMKSELNSLLADPTSNFLSGDGTAVNVTVAQ